MDSSLDQACLLHCTLPGSVTQHAYVLHDWRLECSQSLIHMMLISWLQSDVQCILKLLGCKQHLRVASGGSPQADGFGNDMPSSLLSSGEEVLSATNISETLNPASSSQGVVNACLEPLVREFASVNSATSSSTDAAGPITKETYCATKSPVMPQLNRTYPRWNKNLNFCKKKWKVLFRMYSSSFSL